MDTETEVMPVEADANVVLTQKSAFYWFAYWMGKAAATAALWGACFVIGLVGLVILVGPLVALILGFAGTIAIWAPQALGIGKVRGGMLIEKSTAYWIFYWTGKIVGTASLWAGASSLGFLGILLFMGPALGLIAIGLGTVAIWSSTVHRNNE